MQVQPEEYIVLRAAGRTLRVTAEHPLAVAAGTFREASSYLRAGDHAAPCARAIFHLAPAQIESVARVKAERPAYNLLVTPGGTYLAHGLIVHNKGLLPARYADPARRRSETAIAAVRPGDQLLAFTPAGEIVTAEVAAVLAIEKGQEHAVVTTDRVALRVTLEHPFYVGDGTFKTLEALKIGRFDFRLGRRKKPERAADPEHRAHPQSRDRLQPSDRRAAHVLRLRHRRA